MTQGFDTGSVSTVGYNWTKNWAQYVAYPVSNELHDILSKLIATDERQRYPTATSVLRDLKGKNQPSSTPQSQRASSIKTVAVSPGARQVQPIGSAVIQPPGASPANQPPQKQPPSSNKQPARNNYYAPHNAPAQAVNQPPYQPAIQGVAAPTTLSQNKTSQANQTSTTQRKKVSVGAGFWVKYGLFTHFSQLIAYVVAMIITALFAISVHPDIDNVTSSEMASILELLYWMQWPVAGFFVGVGQWLAIRKWLPRALWWLPATVASFWVIALAIATNYTGGLSGLLFGGFVGLPQWLAMRNHAPRANWWPAWMVVFTFVLFRAISTGASSTLGWLVMAPLLDGIILTWILRQQTLPSTAINAASTRSVH